MAVENLDLLRRQVGLTPEELARGNTYDQTSVNRAELESEIARARDPNVRAALQFEHDRLFSGGPAAERSASSFRDGFPELSGTGPAPGARAAPAEPAGLSLDAFLRGHGASGSVRETLPNQPQRVELADFLRSMNFEAPAAKPETTLLDRAKDVGISALQGTIGVPQAAVGAADIFTGGQAGKFLENEGGLIGFRPNQAIEYLNTKLSPAQQAANKRVSDASKGQPGDDQDMLSKIMRVGEAAVRNPSVIGHSIVQSLPAIGAGGVAARGMLALAPKLGVAATGFGEGLVSAGQQAESIRTDEANPDRLLTGTQSALAAGTGLGIGLIGAFSGKLAKSLGLEDVDSMVAGVRAAGPAAERGLVKRVLGGAVTEGFLEELPQSVLEQVAQNLALGKPLDTGVDQAAVLGTLSGAAMGGGVQLLHRSNQATDLIQNRESQQQAAAASTALAAAKTPEEAAAAAQALAFGPTESLMSRAVERMGPPSNLMGLDAMRERGAPDMPATDPMLDRMLTVREQLMAPAVRQGIEERFGRDALLDTVYSLQTADNRNIPDKTRELLLTKAENRIRGALLTPEGSGVEKAPGIEGKVLDPVELYVNAQRKTNTPAARFFVHEFEQGRITPQDVQEVLIRNATTPPSEADIRLGDAAARARPAAELEIPSNATPLAQDGLTVESSGARRGVQDISPGTMAESSVIDQAANEAAPSPQNDLTEPTDAQKEAGNYKLGHDTETFPGLNLSIENPQGSQRKGTDKAGKPWSTTMRHHYGYVRATVDATGEHVDAFIKPGTPKGYTGDVYVVDQYHADGAYDEPKVMMGFESEAAAMEAYRSNYDKDWKGGKAITPMSFDQFKAWVFNPATSTKPAKPLAERVAETKQPEGAGNERNVPDGTGAAAQPEARQEEGRQVETGGRAEEVKASTGAESTEAEGPVPAVSAEQVAADTALRAKIEMRKRLSILKALKECLGG